MAAELLQQYEPEIERVALLPSDGGRFEVSLNGELIYSKLHTARHAEAGEVAKLVDKYLKANQK